MVVASVPMNDRRTPIAHSTERAPLGAAGAIGDAACSPFDLLYAAYRPLLRRVAMRKFGVPPRDAEDLVQDVFATYLVREAEVRNPPAYLYNAISKASQRYGQRRAYGRAERQIDDHQELPGDSTEHFDDEIIRMLMLRATMEKLGPSCRDTLYRFHVLGEKAASIAASREKKENYIYRLLNYCRNRARDIYLQMMNSHNEGTA